MPPSLMHARLGRLFALAMLAGCAQADDLLQSMQYTPLVPPTNLMVPGAVLAIEDEMVGGERQEKFQMSCGPRASLGQDAMIMQSSTVNQSLTNKGKSSWTLDGSALARIGIEVDSAAIRSVTATITNAKILSISDADVLDSLGNRSEACKAAIRQRLAQGYKMTMISSALVADLTYLVEWDEQKTARMSAKDKVVQLQKIAANLGGGYSRIGQKRIETKQLALGIRTDAFLLALSIPDMQPWTDSVIEQAMAEKKAPERPMRANVSEPDSPYTLPSGGTYNWPELSLDD